MVTSVSGSSSGAGARTGSFAPSGRALDADLARSEVQLSDWTHCVSAKTPKGKEKIAEIRTRVDDLKAKMKAAEAAPKIEAGPAPAPAGALGHRLNVFA